MPKTIGNKKKVKDSVFHIQNLSVTGLIAYDSVSQKLYNTSMDPDNLDASYQILEAKLPVYDAHLIDVANPHFTTKSQVGLGNVENLTKAQKFTDPAFTGSLTVDSAQLAVKDGFLRVNVGETGAGITGGIGGFSVSRGTLDTAYAVYSELDQCFIEGTGVALNRVVNTDPIPTVGAIPIWNSATQLYSTAGNITPSYFVTVNGIANLTNKTLVSPTINGATCTGIFTIGATIGLDFGNGRIGILTSAPTVALEINDGDFDVRATTAGQKAMHLFQTPGFFLTNLALGAQGYANGPFVGISAASRGAAVFSGHAMRAFLPLGAADDAILKFDPRTGSTGVGYDLGQDHGYPSTAQLVTDGIAIKRGSFGIGVADPQYELDVLGNAVFRGPILTGESYTVRAGEQVRAGNVLQVYSDSTVSEAIGANFVPAGVVSSLSQAAVSGSTVHHMTAKRCLVVSRITTTDVVARVYGIDGTTISQLSTQTFPITGASGYKFAAVMPDGRRAVLVSLNHYLTVYINDDNTFTQTTPDTDISLFASAFTQVVAMTATSGLFVSDLLGSLVFTAVKFTFIGNILTLGAPATAGTAISSCAALCSLDANTAVAIYLRVGVYYARVITMTDPLTIGAEAGFPITVSTNYIWQINACPLTATKVFVVARDSATGFYVYMIGTVAGTNIAFAAAETILASVTTTTNGRSTPTKIKDNVVVIGYMFSNTLRAKYYDPALYTVSPFLSAEFSVCADIGFASGYPFGSAASLGSSYDVVMFSSGATNRIASYLGNTVTSLKPTLTLLKTMTLTTLGLPLAYIQGFLNIIDERTAIVSYGDHSGGSSNPSIYFIVKRQGSNLLVKRQRTVVTSSMQTCFSSDRKFLAYSYTGVDLTSCEIRQGRVRYNDTTLGPSTVIANAYAFTSVVAKIDQDSFIYVNSNAVPAIQARVISYASWNHVPTVGAVTSLAAAANYQQDITRISYTKFLLMCSQAGFVTYRIITITPATSATAISAATITAIVSDGQKTLVASNGTRTHLIVYWNGTTMGLLPAATNAAETDITLGTPITVANTYVTSVVPDVRHITNGLYAVAYWTAQSNAVVSLVYSTATRALATSVAVVTTVTVFTDIQQFLNVRAFNDTQLIVCGLSNANFPGLALLRIEKDANIVGIAKENGYSGQTIAVHELSGSHFDFYTAGKRYILDLDGHPAPEYSKYMADTASFNSTRGIRLGVSPASTELALSPQRVIEFPSETLPRT